MGEARLGRIGVSYLLQPPPPEAQPVSLSKLPLESKLSCVPPTEMTLGEVEGQNAVKQASPEPARKLTRVARNGCRYLARVCQLDIKCYLEGPACVEGRVIRATTGICFGETAIGAGAVR